MAALTREHWVQTVGTVLTISLLGAGMLTSAVVYIEGSNRDIAQRFMEAQNVNEKRITTLEIEQSTSSQSSGQLSLEVEKLREAEENLSTAVQILTDKLAREDKRR